MNEWERMKATDSRECRNCHHFDAMLPENQAPRAREQHMRALTNGQTCIDCHKGIAHHLPKSFDRATIYDEVHDRLEKEKVKCRLCHRRMAGGRSDDDDD